TLEGLDPLLQSHPPRIATMKRFLARPTSTFSRELMESALNVGVLDVSQVHAIQQHLAELEKTEFAPLPFVTGDDLTSAGLTPGPNFKRVLDAVYDAQLEGRVTKKQDATALALHLWETPG